MQVGVGEAFELMLHDNVDDEPLVTEVGLTLKVRTGATDVEVGLLGVGVGLVGAGEGVLEVGAEEPELLDGFVDGLAAPNEAWPESAVWLVDGAAALASVVTSFALVFAAPAFAEISAADCDAE